MATIHPQNGHKLCDLRDEGVSWDDMEAELTREIFASSMELSEKIHLAQLLSLIARIADSAEDASDELEFAAMKAVL